MSPKSIAALRDFSAACRHSHEPARSVADLAQLLAALAEADAAAAAPAPSALAPDEPEFPPVVAAGTEPAAEEQPAAAA